MKDKRKEGTSGESKGVPKGERNPAHIFLGAVRMKENNDHCTKKKKHYLIKHNSKSLNILIYSLTPAAITEPG
jgi:hypothetical protein